VLVTTASRSPEVERRERERRYLIMMGVRVIAFVVAIVVARGWVRVIAIALALVLPWVAVVVANSGPRRSSEGAPSLYRRRQRELGESPQPPPEIR
jgi:Flp pilus assembly protein TadB